MYQSPSYMKNVPNDDNPVFGRPRVAILNEKDWLYIQRRNHISPRELQIAKLVCQGLSNDQIATDLSIKHGTVKTHIRNIYRRIHVRNKISMLLKFVDQATKFPAKSDISPSIPIVAITKKENKSSTSLGVSQKK